MVNKEAEIRLTCPYCGFGVDGFYFLGESRDYPQRCGWEDDTKQYGCGKLFVFHIEPNEPDVEYFTMAPAPEPTEVKDAE